MKLRKVLATSIATIVAASSLAVAASAATAGVAFQTNVIYSFRNNIGQTTDVFWDAANYEETMEQDIEGGGYYAPDFAANDVTFTQDGTYTVSAKGIATKAFTQEAAGWTVIRLCTDIPIESCPADMTITIDDVKVDGTSVVSGVKLGLEKDANGLSIVGEDVTADDYSDVPGFATLGKCAAVNIINTYSAGLLTECALGSDIEVTFTVAGFAAADTAAADDTAADDTAAPATGDTAAATDASKGNADTGIEGVAAIAGLAIVATAAAIVAKKRK